MRDRYVGEGAPPVPLTLSTSRVEPVSRDLARSIIYRYEWLGTMAGTTLHFGLFFGAFCAGVTCVAVGGGAALPRMGHVGFGIDRFDLALLARGACVHWAPPGSNSRLVSWTVRLLARSTRIKVLIAYADTDAGEIGTIYQACNWYHLGRGASSMQYVHPNGRIWNNRTFTGWCAKRRIDAGTGRARLVAAGWKAERANAKHRYAVIVDRNDRALADRLAKMATPYPKRGGSAGSGTPGDQPGGGGATPTPPLGGVAV